MKNLLFTYFIVLVLAILALARQSSGLDVEPMIAKAAKSHGVEYALLRAIVLTESSARPHAISSTGDIGLGQISPATARAHGWDLHRLRTDPMYNLNCSATYLAELKLQWSRREPLTWFTRYHSRNLVLRFRYKLALGRYR